MQDEGNLRKIYEAIPGGQELLAWFGCLPFFHDAEIVSLTLNRRRPSILRVYGWVTTSNAEGFFVPDKIAVVSFTLNEVSHVELNGFNHQNVVDGISLLHATTDFAPTAANSEYEVHLEPCWGMDGVIRCRSISVSFVPGKPDD